MRIFIIKNVYTHRGCWQCTVAMAKWSFVHTSFLLWRVVFILIEKLFSLFWFGFFVWWKCEFFIFFLKNWFAGFWLVVFYREDQSSFDPLPSIFLFNKKKKGWNLNTPLLNWFFFYFLVGSIHRVGNVVSDQWDWIGCDAAQQGKVGWLNVSLIIDACDGCLSANEKDGCLHETMIPCIDEY